MSVAHYFETMDYGPAPEADGEARAWLKRHDATFGHFIAGKFVAPGFGQASDDDRAGHRQDAGQDRARHRCRCRGGRRRRAIGAAVMGKARRSRSRPSSLCAGAHAAASCASVRGAGSDRQWQADPGNPRSRRATRCAPFPVSRRLGAIAGARIRRPRSDRCDRPDHPLEFSAADAGLEDRARAGDRQHRGAEAGRIHVAHRAAVRRTRGGSGPAAGRVERGDR